LVRDFLLLDGGGVVFFDMVLGWESVSRLLDSLTSTRTLTLDVRDVGVLVRGVGRGDLVRLLCVCMLFNLFSVGGNVVKAD
jgi:hypothetical protein